jgi:hypothetical protein
MKSRCGMDRSIATLNLSDLQQRSEPHFEIDFAKVPSDGLHANACTLFHKLLE